MLFFVIDVSCSPPISGIEELYQKLNQTNDLQNFIICIRRNFRKNVR